MSAESTVRSVLKILLAVFASIVVLVACTIAATGIVYVSVHEKKPGGTHITLFVPAILVPIAMHFVPPDEIRRQTKDVAQYLPAIRIASRELTRCPDGPLVEVHSREQNVSVVKQGNSMLVNVEDSEESVHVSFPLRAVESVVARLEAASPPV